MTVGIKKLLAQNIMKYDDRFGGVIIAYKSVKVQSKSGKFFNEKAGAHIALKAKAVMFRPQKGQIIEGVVNKVSPTHVGLLVSNVFNAAVYARQMGETFAYDEESQCFYDSENETNIIQIGTKLNFVVKDVGQKRGIIQIFGTLKQEEAVEEAVPLEIAQGIVETATSLDGDDDEPIVEEMPEEKIEEEQKIKIEEESVKEENNEDEAEKKEKKKSLKKKKSKKRKRESDEAADSHLKKRKKKKSKKE
eukprot:TRINITY_DN779834_c0_g1_i1.p1 TRINITY_DN779834_c0_g1~~TRINITY_DN779834_c0_g1_i1.p1  ORF type:complete len:287 (+),score=109.40 TRINITY_DN779834_c0_g1_i1:118-861(+)